MKPARKRRKDAYSHPWYKAQALKHARARWRAKKRARGLCTKCGRRRAVAGKPYCTGCRLRHNAQQRAAWQRRQRNHQGRGWATKKQLPTLLLLEDGRVWTPAGVAFAFGGRYVPGVAGKTLRRLTERGLAAETATGWRITTRGRGEIRRWRDG